VVHLQYLSVELLSQAQRDKEHSHLTLQVGLQVTEETAATLEIQTVQTEMEMPELQVTQEEQ
jgi:hypothetical protein